MRKPRLASARERGLLQLRGTAAAAGSSSVTGGGRHQEVTTLAASGLQTR